MRRLRDLLVLFLVLSLAFTSAFADRDDDDEEEKRSGRNPSSAAPPPPPKPAEEKDDPAAAPAGWEIPSWFAPRFPGAAEEKKPPIVRRHERRQKLYDEEAVRIALNWLAVHQDPDGLWDADGYMSQCRLNQCDGTGYALYDPGVTGLALLAFLADGNTPSDGTHAEVVAKGIHWLITKQDAEGCFGPRKTNHFTYNHAVAATAVAEAYGTTGSPLLKTAAQKGVDFIGKCQNPYLAWRYGIRPGDNDTSVTGWMISALQSAKAAGLRVDEARFDGTKAWLEKVTEPEYGRVGYTARGTGPCRPQDLMDKYPADKCESLTAVGIFGRVLIGEDPAKSEMIQKGANLCLKALPVWDAQDGSIDMYYWYWGTLAMWQVGGDGWEPWRVAMRTAALDHQLKDGDEKGSWDPVGPWGRDGGRVYSTAMMTLVLETEKRYALLRPVRGSRDSGFWRKPHTR